MRATLAYYDPEKVKELTQLGWLVMISGCKQTT
jgi:hypothetical protein